MFLDAISKKKILDAVFFLCSNQQVTSAVLFIATEVILKLDYLRIS